VDFCFEGKNVSDAFDGGGMFLWMLAMAGFGVDAYKASEKDLLAEGVTLHSPSEEEI